MCKTYDGDRTQLPIHKKGLNAVLNIYSSRVTEGVPLPEKVVTECYGAMTDKLHVRIMHFVALIDLVYRYYNDEKGLWGMGPELLFSAHLPNTLTRFRSKEMTALHDSWLSFQLAERNRKKLDSILRTHCDLALVSLCCCGSKAVAFGDAKHALELSGDFNYVRTTADMYGQVDETTELDDIPNEAMPDLLRSAFKRVIVNAHKVAHAQNDCFCCSISPTLKTAGVIDSEIKRAQQVQLFLPELSKTKETVLV